MQFPDDRAAWLTELIMKAWLEKLKARKITEIDTAYYNTSYEACYEVLKKQVKDA